jgi:hypothetical protein
MRMFLVGMCDIFLLLYLTALAEVEARPTSALTVQDFVQLKEAKELLEKQEQARAAALQAKEREAVELRNKLAALTSDKERIESEKRKAESNFDSSKKKSEEELRRAAVEFTERAKQLEKMQEEARKAFEEKEARLATQVAERELELSNERRVAAQRAEQLAAQEQKSLQLVSEVQRQQALADEARRKAEEALSEREKALAERQKALTEAEDARQAREQALTYASQALSQAEAGKNLADVALRRAQEAELERSAARQKVQKITQSAATAFARNIEGKIVSVEVAVSRRALLGDSKRQSALSLLPIIYGNERVVFAPVSHLELSGIDDPQDLKALDIRISGQPATRVYRAASFPELLAIAVPAEVESVSPIEADNVRAFMPTLMSVRTGAERSLGDRVRELAVNHFLFPRDRLTQEGAYQLRFVTAGFRGTGDFGEQILKGDQIVDLEGNFIGIARTANDIVMIPDLDGWRAFDIGAGDLLPLAETL